MKVYVTCPVTHTKKRLDILPIVKEIVLSCKMKAYIFKIGGKAKEIFTRDYNQLKNCDLIIAEVSERSHGVGVEIGMSYCLGLNRILLLQKNEYITKLIEGMPKTIIIKYDTKDDLKKKLCQILKKNQKK